MMSFPSSVFRFPQIGSDLKFSRLYAISSPLPEFCGDVRVSDASFFTGGKYLFREMPAVYLLDRKGTVVLKEVRLQTVVETVKSR